MSMDDAFSDAGGNGLNTNSSNPAPVDLGLDFATTGVVQIPKLASSDNVAVINGTYSDLNQPGAREKHADATLRAYNDFKSQTYAGNKIFVMVDSSSEPNAEMQRLAQEDETFLYFSTPDRDTLDPETITKKYDSKVCDEIRPTSYYHGAEFAKTLEWIRQDIDEEATNPKDYDNNRPALGAKRNFAIRVAMAELAKRGLELDVIVQFDDDIYGPKFVEEAVENLQNGYVFTAPTSYHVAYPVADHGTPGEFHVEFGEYVANQAPESYSWLDPLGHVVDPKENGICSTLPYGFTYAYRREAWEDVGGFAPILRGEDRSFFIPMLEKFGEKAVNLRTDVTDQLVRIYGDNSSKVAKSIKGMASTIPEELAVAAKNIFESPWREMLEFKFTKELTGSEPQMSLTAGDNIVTTTPPKAKANIPN